MLKVGLTGSIAVGKSLVVEVLRKLGCRTIDADRVAREVVEPGTPGLAAVVQHFGPTVLSGDGSLDRAKLAALVFQDDARRLELNSILHPFIIKRQDETIQQWEHEAPDSIVVVDAALMIESGGYKRFDKLIVVHCSPEIQLQRLMARDELSREEAERRIRAQMPQDEKKTYADFLIDTSQGFEAARGQAETVFHQLQTIVTSPERRSNRE